MDADLNESMVGKRSGGFRISGFGLGFRLGGILGQAKVNREELFSHGSSHGS